ncbi:MAG: response regulator [Candidatus Theseobacter exili]|nr:response regulator [Candidatus Theseobacter exili]
MSTPIKILVVDDNVLFRKTVVDVLEDEGFHVFSADSAKNALRIIKNSLPDLMLLDIRMPEMDGITFFTKIKKQYPEISVMLMTAYGKIDSAVQAMRDGVCDYLTKPFDLNEMLVRIHSVLEKKHLQKFNLELQAVNKVLYEREKELEKVIKERDKAKNKYLMLFEHVPQKIFMKDENSAYISCNKNYARILKINQEEIEGKTDHDFFQKELADKYESDDKKVLDSGESLEMEEKCIIGKKEIIVGTLKVPVKDKTGKIIGILGIFRDITEHRAMENELQASNESNWALFEYNPIATIAVDYKGKIVMYNRAQRESGKRLPAIGNIMYKDYAGKHKINMHAKLMKCIKFGKTHNFPELKYGNTFLSVTISPFPNGAIIVSQDITEQKKVVEKLKSYYEKLQDRDEKLVHSEKLAYVGRVAANIAHEVRNPLGNVVFSSQQLKRIVKAEPFAIKQIDIIDRNAVRINFLISELLNCARPPKLRKRMYDIHKIIASVLGTIKSQTGDIEKVKVIKKFSVERSRIKVDKEQMKRVFLNIILNAVDAMSHKREKKLTVITKLVENSFTVQINDTGKGIPENDIISIFDPFFSLKAKGVGLGLTLCHGIITGHSGTVSVESKLKKGTTFIITLPLK